MSELVVAPAPYSLTPGGVDSAQHRHAHFRARAGTPEDLVLDHDIPHLWERKNSLTDRKTQASIRCVPLLGVWLEAAQELHCRAVRIVDVKQPGATPLNFPGMARWATRWSRKGGD
jgi:hypothetical protein